ncbi:MAG TPA: EscU/YscU/HrcU family type III secretion system export apparatus switch protein [Anaeromyxobacter sp.]|nr:EscU/YscU/HrcU family type III secretion system export apparatus switch protein [Anaeromyxobacter sp.]
MAEESDREARTEEATPRRLRRAAEQGQFPIGRDAVLVAGTGAACLALAALAGVLRNGLASLFGQAAASLDRTPFASLPGRLAIPALAAAGVCVAAALAGVLATLAQTQGRTGSERPTFDLSRVLRGFSALRRLAEGDFALQLLLALGKAVFIGLSVWPSVHRDLARAPSLLTADPGAQLAAGFGILAAAARPAFTALAILAAADFGLTHWRFHRDQRMTKQEVRDEMKEEEGDPQMKRRRRKRHRDLLRNQAVVEVPRADALVVNPTHVAVALRYRRDEGRAPRVTAKGKGELAEHMRALARQNGVAIVQDVPLARFLYRKVKVGREIPAQTYRAVAAILAFVYRLAGRREGLRA